MRGLLDLADDPGSQGLLSLGLRLMSTPGKFSTALGTAGLGAMGDLNSATQAKQRRDLLAQEEKSRAFQMLMQQQQMQQLIEQQARQKAIDAAHAGAIRSPDQQAMAANGGPTMAAANAAPGMMPTIDQQALIQGLIKAGAGQEAYQMLQPKPKKLLRLEPMRGKDGQMVNVAVYEDGTTSILPFGVRPDIVLQGLGDRVTAIDKNATQGGASFAMGQSPDSKADKALGWANNRLGRDRLNWDQGGGAAVIDGGGLSQAPLVKMFGKPSAGFRWKADGSQEPIPGGPADEKKRNSEMGKGTVSDVIGSLRLLYDDLDKDGGITNPEKGKLANLSAGIASSEAGQAAGKLFGTYNQSKRNTIAQQRPLLLQAIMRATGMSAKQMDSNAELKLYLATATDPTLDVATNKRALDMIEQLYGVGGSGATPTAGPKKISNDADFDALPSGTEFIAPDGTTRRKP